MGRGKVGRSRAEWREGNWVYCVREEFIFKRKKRCFQSIQWVKEEKFTVYHS